MSETGVEEKINHLRFLQSQLLSVAPNNKKKYFHFKTLNNFIYHINEIKNPTDLDWIYHSLIDHINAVMEFSNDIDVTIGYRLYEEYIIKIAGYYSKNLRFSMYAGSPLTFLYMLLAGLLWYFLNIYYGIGIALILYIINLNYFFRKKREFRLYGIFY
jgi:hypothetical protein